MPIRWACCVVQHLFAQQRLDHVESAQRGTGDVVGVVTGGHLAADAAKDRLLDPCELAGDQAPVVNSVNLPVMLMSGILLPMSLAPGRLDGMSHAVPTRYVVESVRAAFVGHYGTTFAVGARLTVGLATAATAVGVRLFQGAGA